MRGEVLAPYRGERNVVEVDRMWRTGGECTHERATGVGGEGGAYQAKR